MTCSISGNPINYFGVVSPDKVELVNLDDRECRLLQRISWQTVKKIRESESRWAGSIRSDDVFIGDRWASTAPLT